MITRFHSILSPFARKAGRSAAVVALCSLAACADPDIDRALKNLGSDDASVREAAQREIIELGEPALQRCRRERDAATEAEVRARLAAICARIERDLQEVACWKSRWFRIEKNGAPAGWLHQSASRVTREGKHAWQFVEERRWKTNYQGEPIERDEHQFTALADDRLTPIECQILHKEPAPEWKARAVFGPTSWTLEVFSENTEWAIHPGKPVDMRFDGLTTPVGPMEHVAFQLIERHSAAGEDDFSLAFSGDDSWLFINGNPELAFDKEVDLELAGRKYHVRKFVELHQITDSRRFWVSPELGVLKAEIPGMEFFRLEENEASSGDLEIPLPAASGPGEAQQVLEKFRKAIRDRNGADIWAYLTEEMQGQSESDEVRQEFEKRKALADEDLEYIAQTHYGVGAHELRGMTFHQSVLKSLEHSFQDEENSLRSCENVRFRDAEVSDNLLRVRVSFASKDGKCSSGRIAFSREKGSWRLDFDAGSFWAAEEEDSK